jgi:hypothetical protein
MSGSARILSAILNPASAASDSESSDRRAAIRRRISCFSIIPESSAGILITFACHSEEVLFTQNGYAQLTRFIQLASGILARQHIIRFFETEDENFPPCDSIIADACSRVRMEAFGQYESLSLKKSIKRTLLPLRQSVRRAPRVHQADDESVPARKSP